jgi:hypothetical protein
MSLFNKQQNSNKLLATSKVASLDINNPVRKRAKALQCKYNLSDEQLEEIVNSLYCISENIIKANIDKQLKINK